jgi:hypothetical protein
MAFAIHLLPGTIRGPDGQRLGEIRIGEFIERFDVYPIAGTVEDVAAAWLLALWRLVSGSSAVGLATASNMGWMFYRLGDEVLVHQNLFLPGSDGELDATGHVTRVPAYQRVSEDGSKISEWATSTAAIRAFLTA